LKVIHNVHMEIDLDTSEDLNFILAHDTPNSSYLQVLEQFMTEKRGEYV
jgi:hypothetical protein